MSKVEALLPKNLVSRIAGLGKKKLIALALVLIAVIVGLVSTVSGGGGGGGSSCASTMANWVAATAYNDTNGVQDTQFAFTFGTNNGVSSWIENELSNYLQDATGNGQSYADSRLVGAAAHECVIMQRDGIDISNLPQHS